MKKKTTSLDLSNEEKESMVASLISNSIFVGDSSVRSGKLLRKRRDKFRSLIPILKMKILNREMLSENRNIRIKLIKG